MVVGVVGSGKSSLIAALLGELHSQGGSLQVNVKQFCYTPNQGWCTNLGAGRERYKAGARGDVGVWGGRGHQETGGQGTTLATHQAVMAVVLVCVN